MCLLLLSTEFLYQLPSVKNFLYILSVTLYFIALYTTAQKTKNFSSTGSSSVVTMLRSLYLLLIVITVHIVTETSQHHSPVSPWKINFHILWWKRKNLKYSVMLNISWSNSVFQNTNMKYLSYWLRTARITILVYMLFGPTNLIYFMKSHMDVYTVAR